MEMEACHVCFLLIICTWFTFVITGREEILEGSWCPPYVNVTITPGSGALSLIGAVKECEANNAWLARAFDFKNDTSYLLPERSYWSGSFLSPWIFFVGCYQQFSDIGLIKFTLSAYIRDKSDDVIPAICQRISKCENYFGIENGNCICVQDIETAHWKKVEDSQCTSLWKGGRQEENRYFTFYKKDTLYQLQADDLCGYVYRPAGKRYIRKNGTPCNQNYDMLCNDNAWTQRADSWNKGITACWDNRRVFPGVNLPDAYVGSNKYGWFGAFKRVAPLPKAETVNDSETHFLMKLKNGKVIEQRERYNSGTAEFFCVTVVVGEKEMTTPTDLTTQISTEEIATNLMVHDTRMLSSITSLIWETTVTSVEEEGQSQMTNIVVGGNEVTTDTGLTTQTSKDETSTSQIDSDTSMSSLFTKSPIADSTMPSGEEDGQSQMKNIGLYIGIGVGALLLLGIIVTVVIWKREQQKKKNKDRPTNVTYATQASGEHINPPDGAYSMAYSHHNDGAYSVVMHAADNASDGARGNAEAVNTYGSLHPSKHQQKNEDIYDHARKVTATDNEYDTFQKKNDSSDPSAIYDHTQNVHMEEGTYDEFKGK